MASTFAFRSTFTLTIFIWGLIGWFRNAISMTDSLSSSRVFALLRVFFDSLPYLITFIQKFV